MITREFSMHEDPGGIIRLCQVLATIPANTWQWSMLDYEGEGRAPGGQPYEQFVSSVRDGGYPFDWPALTAFAADLGQTIWCLVVAVHTWDGVALDRVMADDYEQCLVAVEAFDSSTWTVSVNDQALPTVVVRRICGGIDRLVADGPS
ncbi:hypothetical protein SAMN05192558_12147 [Actinokineospora alba]|uniref:Uncharacterized protein n=1 Tax=Actinokineospora alba TaxID=504798 RepID=A0A1H0WGH2_9PSEU|nr:hypothetical protein [Actinokineospora alba]TDP65323.1 hypothetical protein C8E96_0805 [Actinokineospora alba]SDH59710.1 hypothetical protein SAMN05421871_101627 [Actinokineospora alba]SDP89810.1 hypothetical protein SAMN05192558_12147 [Actinokineospora alba]